MRCDRCGYAVPEWLWLAGDHPILVQAGTKIENLEMLEQNIFRVKTTETIQIKLCSEANPGTPVENAQRRLEEAHADVKEFTHIPTWICENCKTKYIIHVPRINCCPTHNIVVCYPCKDELHPEDVQKGDDEQEQSIRSSPSFTEVLGTGSAVSEVRTDGGAEGEASTEPEVGLTPVCPNCKRGVDDEVEHWGGQRWTCEKRSV